MTNFIETLSHDQQEEIFYRVKKTIDYFSDNDIIEIRILTHSPRFGVMSGYFSDHVEMIHAIVAYHGEFNIYITVNQINKEQLSGKNPIDNQLHPHTTKTTGVCVQKTGPYAAHQPFLIGSPG